MPWRETRDPYAILVSEVMLQQTQVDRVIPRWQSWLERWPTVEALAAAAPAEVIVEWQGLGYNRRAVSLHRAARVVAEHGWPDDLTELPGVGPYTAAAIGNFAFGRDQLPVDTNVRRVQERTGESFDGECAQALFDLGATDLPRPDPALRRLPARGGVSLTRAALRAAAAAVALRRLLPAAARSHAAGRRCRCCGDRQRGGRGARPRWAGRDRLGRQRQAARLVATIVRNRAAIVVPPAFDAASVHSSSCPAAAGATTYVRSGPAWRTRPPKVANV